MKVKELIAFLERCNPDADVVAYDADAQKEDLVKVTGAIKSSKEIEIQTERPFNANPR